MSNPIAEVIDTFFNGRPAPKGTPAKIRVRLNQKQMADLAAGRTLRFNAGTAEVTILPPPRRSHEN